MDFLNERPNLLFTVHGNSPDSNQVRYIHAFISNFNKRVGVCFVLSDDSTPYGSSVPHQTALKGPIYEINSENAQLENLINESIRMARGILIKAGYWVPKE